MRRVIGAAVTLAATVPCLGAAPAQASPAIRVSIVKIVRNGVGIGSVVTAVCETDASTGALFTLSTCTVAGAAQSVTLPGSTSVSASTSATGAGPVEVCAAGAASDLSGTTGPVSYCITV
jgi:hypothetical protein